MTGRLAGIQGKRGLVTKSFFVATLYTVSFVVSVFCRFAGATPLTSMLLKEEEKGQPRTLDNILPNFSASSLKEAFFSISFTYRWYILASAS